MVQWGVELILSDEDGQEVDYLRVPFRSDKVGEFFKYCAPWFPLKPGLAPKLVVMHKPSGKELVGRIVNKVGMGSAAVWVVYKGEQMRPRDAIRKMIADLGGEDA